MQPFIVSIVGLATGVGLGYAADRFLIPDAPKIIRRPKRAPLRSAVNAPSRASDASPRAEVPSPTIVFPTVANALRKVSPLLGLQLSVPNLPGAQDLETAEPGIFRAISDMCAATGADFGKTLAYMSFVSGFDPHHAPEGDSYRGAGLLAIGADLEAAAGYPPDVIRQMSGIEQVNGPIRSVYAAYPMAAKDPALLVMGPAFAQKYALKSNQILVAKEPSWSPMAHATTVDEERWPTMKKFDYNGDSVVTLGDIRDVVYAPLTKKIGTFKVA